jgi:hypothetical protein
MTLYQRLKANVETLFGNRTLRNVPEPIARNDSHLENEDAPSESIGVDGLPKKGIEYTDRFRDVIADPLNLLIRKHPHAGTVTNELLTLHNGLKVAANQPYAYYGDFSKLLIYNRGVHEPLEEFCFQQLLDISDCRSPHTILELGAYWGHYSMWMKHRLPETSATLVEPEPINLESGCFNFAQNKLEAQFVSDFVDRNNFTVDKFLKDSKQSKLNVLHSDIQGYESEMLDGASESFTASAIDYTFISTHSERVHKEVIRKLEFFDYNIEIESCPENHSTSFDGLVVASSKRIPPIFPRKISPMGRKDIYSVSSSEILSYLIGISELLRAYPKNQVE